jgi:hypothetical protein
VTVVEETERNPVVLDGRTDLIKIGVRAARVSGARFLPDLKVISSSLADMKEAHRLLVEEVAASPVPDAWADEHRAALDGSGRCRRRTRQACTGLRVRGSVASTGRTSPTHSVWPGR